MRTFNFNIAGQAGIDNVRLLLDGEHAAVAVFGVTQGIDRTTLAAVLRDMAQVCDDGGEAFDRRVRQAQIANVGAMKAVMDNGGLKT